MLAKQAHDQVPCVPNEVIDRTCRGGAVPVPFQVNRLT
jgi:hypothetical protein